MSTFLPAIPYFPNLPSYSQQDFLRLFDRLLPAYYLEPMKNPGPGYEYLQAVAKVMERTSQSVAHMGDAIFIGTSTGGRRAIATVEIYRDNYFFGQVNLLAGTLVGTSDGYLYQTLRAVSFGAMQTGAQKVEVEAIARGYDWNKPGQVTAANGEELSGSINRLVSAVVPEGGSFDPTLQVRQVSPGTYKTYAPFVQPDLGYTVTVQLLLGSTPFAPRAGLVLYVGTSEVERDVYVIETVKEKPTHFECLLRLTNISKNAAGTTIAVDTFMPVSSDAVGGISPALDGLGNDRGMFRQTTNALVQFELTTPSSTQVILLPGTRVQTDSHYIYQTLETVTFPANVSGTISRRTVQAIPLVLPDAYAANGAITGLALPRWGSPSVPDGTITVTQLNAYARESDEAYRARISLLPLVVTPNNIEKLLNQVIGSTVAAEGKTYSWREVWDIRFQTAYDTPANMDSFTQAEINVPVPAYNPNIFAYDYTPEDPLSNRYLGQRGMIVFALPEIAGQEQAYAGLAELLDGATAAGIPLGYILTT